MASTSGMRPFDELRQDHIKELKDRCALLKFGTLRYKDEDGKIIVRLFRRKLHGKTRKQLNKSCEPNIHAVIKTQEELVIQELSSLLNAFEKLRKERKAQKIEDSVMRYSTWVENAILDETSLLPEAIAKAIGKKNNDGPVFTVVIDESNGSVEATDETKALVSDFRIVNDAIVANVKSVLQKSNTPEFTNSEAGRRFRQSIFFAASTADVSKRQVADALGVDVKTLKRSRDALEEDFEAVTNAEGFYDVKQMKRQKLGLYRERKTRSDTLPDELVKLVKEWSHSPEVVQPSTNSRMMKANGKGSKATDKHPIHMLTSTQVEAYQKFLVSGDYVSWKKKVGYDASVDEPIGHTKFNELFKCHCHSPMIFEECACLHCQRLTWRITALARLGTKHHVRDCDTNLCTCKCVHCESNACGDVVSCMRSIREFCNAIMCPKKDYYAGDPDTPQTLWWYDEKCMKGECANCGFDKRFPTCAFLHGNSTKIKVNEWGDVTVRGNKFTKQVVEREYTVQELLTTIRDSIGEYLVHATKATVQRSANYLWTDHFNRDTVMFSMDFANKPTLKSKATPTCGNNPNSTLMPVVVHYLPFVDPIDGKRKHFTDIWVFISDDGKQDAAFHATACRRMRDHYDAKLR